MGVAVAFIGIPIYVVLFFLAIFLLLRKPRLTSNPSDGRWMVAGFVITAGLMPFGSYLLSRTLPFDESVVFIFLYLYLGPFVIYVLTRIQHSASYIGKGAMLAFMAYPIFIVLAAGIIESLKTSNSDNGKSLRACFVVETKPGLVGSKVPHVDVKTENIAWHRFVSAHSLEKGSWCANIGESLIPMSLRVYSATEENYRNYAAIVSDIPTVPLQIAGESGDAICIYMSPQEPKQPSDPEWQVRYGRCDR